MADIIVGLSVLVLLSVPFFILRLVIGRVTIFEFEQGFKYMNGQFKKILSPGSYWYWKPTTTIHSFDMRPKLLTVSGQELLSADHISVKISLALEYKLVDLKTAIHQVQHIEDSIYLSAQLAIRDIISKMTMDEVLENRKEISVKMNEILMKEVEHLGIQLLFVRVKDIMLPGELKKAFAEIVKARKEALSALEKARGEQAVLRKLANLTDMIKNNPHLMQLRLLQSMDHSSGNTFVIDLQQRTDDMTKTTMKAMNNENNNE